MIKTISILTLSLFIYSCDQYSEGKITLKTSDGFDKVYEGGLKNGKIRHGYGKETYKNGGTFEGTYIDDNRIGFGRFTYPGGGMYIGEHFEGSITNFAVFTGLLSDGDAVSHYNNGIPNKDLSGETNLEAYWKMNENSGTTVIDYVGGRNGEFDGDEPTWIKAMDVTNTYHKGKQVIANMSKNERG